MPTGPTVRDWAPAEGAIGGVVEDAVSRRGVFSANDFRKGDQSTAPSDWIPAEGEQVRDRTLDEKHILAVEASQAAQHRYDENLRKEAEKNLNRFSAEQANQLLRELSPSDRNTYLQVERENRDRPELFDVYGEPEYKEAKTSLDDPAVRVLTDEQVKEQPTVGGVAGDPDDKPRASKDLDPEQTLSASDKLYRAIRAAEVAAGDEARRRIGLAPEVTDEEAAEEAFGVAAKDPAEHGGGFDPGIGSTERNQAEEKGDSDELKRLKAVQDVEDSETADEAEASVEDESAEADVGEANPAGKPDDVEIAEALEGLSYPELQEAAGDRDIKKNQSKENLKQAILEHDLLKDVILDAQESD